MTIDSIDHRRDEDADGYNIIEEFLNSTDPHRAAIPHHAK